MQLAITWYRKKDIYNKILYFLILLPDKIPVQIFNSKQKPSTGSSVPFPVKFTWT